MKSSIITVFILLLSFYSIIAEARTRTEIKIVKHDSVDSNHRVEIKTSVEIRTSGEKAQIDILIFVENKNSSQLSMISDKKGEPYLAERKGDNRWMADFFVTQSPSAIYAIATQRSEYSNWSKQRDLSALKRLGIERKKSINGVLSLLDEFGWIPTGYTFIGVSSLRGKGDYSSPNQANTSNICQTDSGSCPLIEYASHGERCFCNAPSGPVYGVIIPKP